VLGDILAELRTATAYVLDVPHRAAGYRIASLMCLMPAYETILSAAQRPAELFTAGHQFKISRATMVRCIHDAVSMATDDEAIRRFSQDAERATLSALQADALAP
jgi:hypothetical protein